MLAGAGDLPRCCDEVMLANAERLCYTLSS